MLAPLLNLVIWARTTLTGERPQVPLSSRSYILIQGSDHFFLAFCLLPGLGSPLVKRRLGFSPDYARPMCKARMLEAPGTGL